MTTTQVNYDSDDLRAIESCGLLRTDAGESVFFARQLEALRSKSYDVRRAALSALTIFPMGDVTDPGAEYITYRQYDTVGSAKIIANYADDLPRADVQGREFVSPVRGIGDSYGYSVQEIRAANKIGVNLTDKKRAAARRAHDETINKFAWTGDPVSGLPGFLSNTNIPGYVIPATGTGSSKLWATKTADQILADLNGLVNSVFVLSKGIHRPNEVWLPHNQYTYISSTARSGTSDTTILDYFLSNNPFVQRVVPVLELAGAGASGTDIAIAADNSVDNYQLNILMMFMEHAPQPRNLEFVVPCESRFGGVTIEYPLAFAKADSI